MWMTHFIKIYKAYSVRCIQDKSIDAGYSHPAILQALAYIQYIEIHSGDWENDVLVPHDTLEGNLCSIINQTVLEIVLIYYLLMAIILRD